MLLEWIRGDDMSSLTYLELILLFIFFTCVANNIQIKLLTCDEEELRKYIKWTIVPCLKAPIFILLVCSPLALIYIKFVMVVIPIFVILGTFDLYRKEPKKRYVAMMFFSILFSLFGLAPI